MNEEFSFGTLATDELRIKQLKSHNQGLVHLNQIEPRDPLPGQPIKIFAKTGSDISVKGLTCHYTTDCSPPLGGRASTVKFSPVRVDWDTLTWGYVTTWEAHIPPQQPGTLVKYQISSHPMNGGEGVLADGGAVFSFSVDHDPSPAWAKDAIIYQIFLDRFYPGDGKDWNPAPTRADFYGGTLRGIIQKMDYLSNLGVNCLWLSPCFASPSHHGYDSTDLFTIEPRLGTLQDLKDLVAEAHRKGIRVLLDFVANHISNQHPHFQSAASDPQSPYRDWFSWQHWPEDYASFFGVKELPELNLSNSSARQHIIDAAVYWINECDIDGYRLDYAYGPPHDFWVDFRRAIRAAKPDAWLFGEIVETSELQRSFEGRLDGTLDFLLLQALRGTFAFDSWDVARFDAFLTAHEAYFPTGFSRPSFLDNHDMNRFLWVTSGNAARLRLAALCQFTLAGPPIIYYGTEVGLSQLVDIWQQDYGYMEEARLSMLWANEQDNDLLNFYSKLIAIRKQYPVLRAGSRQTIHVDAQAGTYAYARADEDQNIVVALNNSSAPQTLTLHDVPNYDLLTQTAFPQNNGLVSVNLEPWSGVLLARQPE